MSNGYIMVDCQSINLLASESQTIPGLHARSIEAIDTGKPIIAVNCEYDFTCMSCKRIFM